MFKSFTKKLNKAFRDDSGASLLELIIAVTILAIVTAPLLNTFIVSAKLNAKAKTMGLETDAITSIYEKIKGTDASEIVSANSDRSVDSKQVANIKKLFQADNATIIPKVETTSDGLYKQVCRQVDINLTGVASGNQPNDRRFDAQVSMTAVPTDSDQIITTSEYTDQDILNDNNNPRAVQMSFNNVWLQPSDTSDPDEIINSVLPKKYNLDDSISEDTIDKDRDPKGQYVKNNQRLITVNLESTTSSDGTVKVTPIITYRYDVEWVQYDEASGKLVTKKIYASNDSETKASDSEETAVFTKKLDQFTYKDAGEKNHHFFDVIIFYKPYYQAVTNTGQNDMINVENEGNLEGDLFLVKEKPDDTKTSSGIIRLYENHPTDPQHFNLRVHTNMGLQKSSDLLHGKTKLSGGTFTFLKIYNSTGSYHQLEDLTNTDPKYTITSLIKEEAIDHIYKYTIKIYESGGIAAGKNPVCTFSGIKVN